MYCQHICSTITTGHLVGIGSARGLASGLWIFLLGRGFSSEIDPQVLFVASELASLP